MSRIITILLCALGLLGAIYVVSTSKEKIPAPPPAQPPSVNPFPAGIAALGIVEPAGRTVDAAAPEAGRVVDVLVKVNDRVEAGQPLYRLDAIAIEADLVRARAARDAAASEVGRIEAWPRAEDFPPVEAKVAEAKNRLADAEDRLNSLKAAHQRAAASDDELRRQDFVTSIFRSIVANAEAELARMKAGSWTADLAVGRATLAAREADIKALEMRLDRLTVKAPSAGSVLKRNIEPGEYAANPGPNVLAPIVLGDLTEMHVRAQVDEEDAPLVRIGARAIGRIRGPIDARIPLTMLRIEPMATPKTQISGVSTELIDTRVIEIVFRADLGPNDPPIYSGQVMDVFIDAQRPGSPAVEAGASGASAPHAAR